MLHVADVGNRCGGLCVLSQTDSSGVRYESTGSALHLRVFPSLALQLVGVADSRGWVPQCWVQHCPICVYPGDGCSGLYEWDTCAQGVVGDGASTVPVNLLL